MSTEGHWQLRMFRRTLKKRLRLDQLRRLLGTVDGDEDCLLVTCGDNNGAINYHLRAHGGRWSFADLESEALEEMGHLLNTIVERATETSLPFPNERFHRIVVIDTHEHVCGPDRFTAELVRVARPGAQVIITVPGGDPKKLANRIKKWVGMTREQYGHVRDGFSVSELRDLMREAGLDPQIDVTFSKFFTEMIELGINFLYVNVLSRKDGDTSAEAGIAPQTRAEIQSVGTSYRIYSLIYPIFWLISQFDRLLFFTTGYVVMVVGRKGGVG